MVQLLVRQQPLASRSSHSWQAEERPSVAGVAARSETPERHSLEPVVLAIPLLDGPAALRSDALLHRNATADRPQSFNPQSAHQPQSSCGLAAGDASDLRHKKSSGSNPLDHSFLQNR